MGTNLFEIKVRGEVSCCVFNDGTHTERSCPELFNQRSPVDLDVSPGQLGPGGILCNGGQNEARILRANHVAVESSIQVS